MGLKYVGIFIYNPGSVVISPQGNLFGEGRCDGLSHLKRGRRKAKQRYRGNPLHLACHRGYFTLAEKLLQVYKIIRLSVWLRFFFLCFRFKLRYRIVCFRMILCGLGSIGIVSTLEYDHFQICRWKISLLITFRSHCIITSSF